MNGIIENINAESEKVGYNPEIDMNWCHLPTEMLSECVKWMDFESKYHLQFTARTEYSLVDNTKLNFDRVEIRMCTVFGARFWKKYVDDGKSPDYKFIEDHLHRFQLRDSCRKPGYYGYKEALQKTVRLLKVSSVENLVLKTCENWKLSLVLQDFAKRSPFRFQNYSQFMYSCNGSCNEENMSPLDVDLISSHHENLDKELPRIIEPFGVPRELLNLVKTWIQLDYEIGTKFTISVDQDELHEWVPLPLGDRLISAADDRYRYHTDNVAKELLLETVLLPDSKVFINIEIVAAEAEKVKNSE